MKHRVAPLVLILSTLAACGGGGDGPEVPNLSPFVSNLTGDTSTEMRGDVYTSGVGISRPTAPQLPLVWSVNIDFTGTYGGSPDTSQKFPLPFELSVDGTLMVADNAQCSYTGTPKHYTCAAKGELANQTEGDHKLSVRALPRNIAGHVWQAPFEVAYTNKFVP